MSKFKVEYKKVVKADDGYTNTVQFKKVIEDPGEMKALQAVFSDPVGLEFFQVRKVVERPTKPVPPPKAEVKK